MSTIIGDFLRLKRLEKRYTLDMTAKSVGVSLNYIARLEKGENSNPSDEIIVNLASTLDIDENSLFTLFGKVPLSTRETLLEHPELNEAISKISSDDKLNSESKKKLVEITSYWWKKLSEDE